jgi:hypothetical protein
MKIPASTRRSCSAVCQSSRSDPDITTDFDVVHVGSDLAYTVGYEQGLTRWEADKVHATLGAPDVDVVPIVAVAGAPVPFGQVSVHGIPVVAAHSLPAMLRALPPVLAPERAAWAASQLRARLPAAA